MRKRIDSLVFATLCAGLLASAASCKKDKDESVAPASGAVFTATAESHKGDSKTHLDNFKVNWDSGDAIIVYNNGGSKSGMFTAKTGNSETTEFGESGSVPPELYNTPPFTAVYPYSVGISGINKVSLPSKQVYVANGFGKNCNPMAAVSSTTTLPFKNLCGLLELQLKGVFKVSKIVVESVNNEDICGSYSFALTEGGTPTLTYMGTSGDNSIELDCSIDGGVQLETTPKSFYIAVPEGKLNNGFTVTVTYVDNAGKTIGTESFGAGKYEAGESGETNRIVRSRIRQMDPKWALMGAIPGKFSITPDKTVYFSKGNLQYVKSSNTWQFAANQWETIEYDNQNVGNDYESQDIVSLFGWAANGKNNLPPYTTSKTVTYGPTFETYPNNFSYDYDWGNNNISNGGGMADVWHTLECGIYDESSEDHLLTTHWEYLVNTRKDDGSKVVDHSYAKVTVNGHVGMMLFPDGFKFNEWPLSTGQPDINYDAENGLWSAYSYTAEEFKTLEDLGVVFLPCAGYRDNTLVKDINNGIYWSSSTKGLNEVGENTISFHLSIYRDNIITNNQGASWAGGSVRLVCF